VGPTDRIFLAERFDRSAAGPVHVEDFAQVADVAPMFKYSESGATYETVGAVVSALTGSAGFRDYIRRLVAMLVVGNTEAHLKNWALVYLDGRTAQLSPVYDFHSLTIYSHYRYQPLALSLNDERVPGRIYLEDVQRLAEVGGVDAQWTADVVTETVNALRETWQKELRAEAEERFPALAAHYTQRLEALPICSVS
jgi:serine/threonine-protein kinase HipA